MKKKNENFRFFAEHFWQLMKQQNGCCALTGRKLTPDNTEVELREPHRKEERTAFSNHYLIIRSLAAMARYASEPEIIDIAIEIVKQRGLEKGYLLRQAKSRKT
ncbi:MAG: hypothetical protein JNM27_05495 [Leptospirales bacterium]|nr:hypothetical protein [Leptospirales bacterium]